LAVGVFDQDIEKHVALEHPHLYEIGRNSQELNQKKTLETFGSAVVHASIIAGLSILAYPGMVLNSAGDYYTFGSSVYTCLIVDLTCRVAFLTCSHNKYTLGAIMFALCGYVFVLVVYPCVKFMADIFEPNMYMVPYHMVSNFYFWFYLSAGPLLALAIDVSVSFAKQSLQPSAVDKVMLLQQHQHRKKSRVFADEQQPLTDMLSPRTIAPHGAALPTHTAAVDTAGLQGRLDLSPYGQQELPCERVHYTARGVSRFTGFIGGFLVLLGLLAYYQSQAAAQVRLVYDAPGDGFTNLGGERPMGTRDDELFSMTDCVKGDSDKDLVCKVTVPRNMTSPILVYYGLGQFYQNFVSYLKSEVPAELEGKNVSQSARAFKCQGNRFQMRDGKIVVPCGSKATSLFNDTLEITGVDINKKDLAWPSDVARYSNPPDYGKRSDTLYLHDLYPDVVSENDGVKSEAFAQWMRPAAMGRVWNKYGWLHEDLHAGQKLELKIRDEFVTSEGTSKMFVLTEKNLFGGRHDGLGLCFMVCGVNCLGMMIVALLMNRYGSKLEKL